MNKPNDPVFVTPMGEGLTKRELFAALAMQGMWANPDPQLFQGGYEGIASWSVRQADALLAALAAKGE